MEATATTNRYADAYLDLLSAGPETVFLLSPSGDALHELIDVLDIITPSIRVLGDSTILNEEMDNFMLATLAADHIAADQLAIRTADLGWDNRIVGPSSVISMVECGEGVIYAGGEAEYNSIDFADLTDQWSAADQFHIDTPPLSRIRDSLEREVGSSTAQDFNALLDVTDTVCARSDGVGADALVLLAGALNNALLNDLSLWAEKISLASSATLSRRKMQLEDGGFITTEKVPRQLGRPRLRLHLTDEFASHSTTELASVAQERLTG